MNREERMLYNKKADVTKLVKMKPGNGEGKNGDLAVGNTANGTSLFAKISNKWYEFSSEESLGAFSQRITGSVSYEFGGYDDSGTGNFLTIGQHFSETSASPGDGTTNEAISLLLPYDCKIISLTVRSIVALGASTFKVYSAPDGANIDVSSTAHLVETSESVNASSANTAYTFNLKANYKLPAGNIAQFYLTTTGNQNHLNYVLTLDYDIPI
tara:strand:+ start:169 stop:807 length:639 start_codon:yes stop_codon:yes gene_type:complete